MSKINRYTRAMRQMRSPLKESVPTNSMQGIYVDTPFTVTTPPEEVITGTGADYTQDADSNGQDTSGLFDANGDQLTAVPPITNDSPDNSYILGPMASMWYAWGNFSTIGYIREADRKMVNLASITGPLHSWDKTSTGFNSYGQLTLEQAKWFVDNPKYGGVDNNYANANYRAFYPGPPSSSTDQYGRYLCTITGVPKQLPSKYQPPDDFTPGTNVSGDDEKSPLKNIVPGSANPDNKGKGLLGKVGDFFKDKIGDLGDFLKGASDTVKEGVVKTVDAIADFAKWTGDSKFDNWAAQAGYKALRMFTDPAQFAGDYLFKGLKEGIKYNPAFTGGGVKIPGLNPKGVKWSERFGKLGKWMAGDNYNVQYFSPNYKKAMDYAKEGGKVVVIPRNKVNTVRGFKNWLKGSVSRGFGYGDIEKVVRTSDSVAVRNATKIIDLGKDPNALKNLQKYAAKGSKANKLLAKIGKKVVPGLNVASVAYDVQDRIRKGDYFGAVLGGIQIIPGPIGWAALGGQLLADSGVVQQQIYKSMGGTGKWNEELELDESMDNFAAELGLPSDPEEYAREMGTYLTLLGVNPMMVSIIMLSVAKKELSDDQKKFVENELPKMMEMMKDFAEGDVDDAKVQEYFYEPRKRQILREVKQPYVMPEEKKVKLTGYRPKLPNKDKMRQIADSMNVPEKVTFAKAETGTWKAGELERGRKSSQGKKNEVLELLGQGEDSWVYMTETSRKKTAKAMYENFTLMNEQGVGTYKITRKEPLRSDYVVFLEYEDGTKSTMLQSELNEKMSDQSEKWRKDWKEPIKYEDQPAYKRVKKILSKEIPLKDIQPEFPKKAPPKLDPETQMHPDMYKRHDYFTKLDPESAKSMAAAPTGDPQIDSEVEKAKKKPK